MKPEVAKLGRIWWHGSVGKCKARVRTDALPRPGFADGAEGQGHPQSSSFMQRSARGRRRKKSGILRRRRWRHQRRKKSYFQYAVRWGARSQCYRRRGGVAGAGHDGSQTLSEKIDGRGGGDDSLFCVIVCVHERDFYKFLNFYKKCVVLYLWYYLVLVRQFSSSSNLLI